MKKKKKKWVEPKFKEIKIKDKSMIALMQCEKEYCGGLCYT